MLELFNAIKEWPVIVQGALGSGLFWLFLSVGQRLIRCLNQAYSKHSKKSRKTWLVNRFAMVQLKRGGTIEQQSFYTSILLYRASRFLFRALMWLALGLTLQVAFEPMSIIGFLGCLYYLGKGIDVVGGIAADGEELEKEALSIEEELVALEEV